MTAKKKDADQPADETTEPVPETPDLPTAVDVVVMPSLRADGTPDQTPDFITIGDETEDATSSDPS